MTEVKDVVDAIRGIVRSLTLVSQAIDAASRIGLSPVPGYTAATVPTAADNTRVIIYVSDETSGATLAFSDGTNWRRVQDRAIVS